MTIIVTGLFDLERYEESCIVNRDHIRYFLCSILYVRLEKYIRVHSWYNVEIG